MLNQLMVFTNADFYHDNLEISRTFVVSNTDDASKVGLEYLRAFERKQFQTLLYLGMTINPKDGSLTIYRNEMHQHPMKEYIEINKQAASTRKVKKVLTPYIEEHDDEEESVDD